MARRRWTSWVLGAAAGALVALAALEMALRLLPTQDGIFAADLEPTWPVHHMTPGRDFTWSSGWHFSNVVRGRINDRGYVAPFDYAAGTSAIVVLGDSYVESLMNRYEDTLQGRLPGLLGGSPAVYNFGISGSALADYVGLAPLLARQFRVQHLVVLLGEGDFVEAFTPSPGHFGWSGEPESLATLRPDVRRDPWRKALRSLSTVRYLRGNLKLTSAALFKSRPVTAPAGPCRPEALRPGDAALVERVAAALPAAYGLAPGRVVVLLDDETARKQLYTPAGTAGGAEQACATRDSLALAHFLDTARAAGMQVIEMQPLFRAAYAATGERVDHSPLDWHWNAVGHRVAAEAVARAVRATP